MNAWTSGVTTDGCFSLSKINNFLKKIEIRGKKLCERSPFLVSHKQSFPPFPLKASIPGPLYYQNAGKQKTKVKAREELY